MDKKPYVLVVDDEQLNQVIIQDTLENIYQVRCVSDGKTCLQQVDQQKPDIILLDVNMPEMNGLEVCKILRENEDHIDLPIIFVSALSSEDEILAGYEVGGDDYLTKPFLEEELLHKINLLLKSHNKKISLKKTADETSSILMNTLQSTGELGVVIDFSRKSYHCKTIKDLIQIFFNSLKNYGLEGSILIRTLNDITFNFSDNIDRPLERRVLNQISTHSERIITFSRRIAFNTPSCTLLIRNMPNDEEKTGRYRDNIAILMDALDARIIGINSELKILAQQQELQQIIVVVQDNLAIVNIEHQQLRAENSQLMSEMGSEIEDLFKHLGLTEKQEMVINALLVSTENKTENLYARGLEVDKTFKKIIEKLKVSF